MRSYFQEHDYLSFNCLRGLMICPRFTNRRSTTSNPVKGNDFVLLQMRFTIKQKIINIIIPTKKKNRRIEKLLSFEVGSKQATIKFAVFRLIQITVTSEFSA